MVAGINTNPSSCLNTHRIKTMTLSRTCWKQMLKSLWKCWYTVAKHWSWEKHQWPPATCGVDRACWAWAFVSAALMGPMKMYGMFWYVDFHVFSSLLLTVKLFISLPKSNLQSGTQDQIGLFSLCWFWKFGKLLKGLKRLEVGLNVEHIIKSCI